LFNEHPYPICKKNNLNFSDEKMFLEWQHFCNQISSRYLILNYPKEKLMNLLVHGLRLILGACSYAPENIIAIYEKCIDCVFLEMKEFKDEETIEQLTYCHFLWASYLFNYRRPKQDSNSNDSKELIDHCISATNLAVQFPTEISVDITISCYSYMSGICKTEKEILYWIDKTLQLVPTVFIHTHIIFFLCC